MSSPFGEMLAELVGRIPGALGAVFLDWEGEAVDQFSHIPKLDILLVGAHWGIIHKLVTELLVNHDWGESELIILNGTERDVIIYPVDDEYCVVLSMHAGTHLATAIEALQRAAEAIRQEM